MTLGSLRLPRLYLMGAEGRGFNLSRTLIVLFYADS
jgi:hypothetical protein